MRGLKVGVLGRHGDDGPDGVDVEARAFYSDGRDVGEDPVTRSINAGLA